MASENIPYKDAQYVPWIINFASVATANATLLNLSGGQTTAITGLSNAFEVAFTENNAAKLNAKGKAANKRALRKSSEQLIRATARVIAANGNIADELKSELGLNVAPAPSVPVTPVTDLAAKGFENGDNKLVWKRNGNTSGTSFIVEARIGVAGPWIMVGSTMQTKFIHTGQTPGVLMFYRVVSQRAGVQSSASNFASVYAISDTEVITLKEAA